MRVLFADISGDGAASLRGEVSRLMLRLAYLRDVKHWGDNNPLFPVTLFKLGDKQRFEVCGVERAGWRNTSPIRAIFRRALEAAGLPYHHPHLFRKTLARIGLKRCRTAEELKAWSQKLSHEDVMATFRNYGEVAQSRQAEINKDLRSSDLAPASIDDYARRVTNALLSAGVIPRLGQP